MNYPTEFIANVLRREYPEINRLISEKINNSLPERNLSDLTQVDTVVRLFLKTKGLKSFTWHNQPGENKTDIRELLMAVVLMFYHPERLYGYGSGKKRTGLGKRLSELTGCKHVIISKNTTSAISAFKTYKSFREEVNKVYMIIKPDIDF